MDVALLSLRIVFAAVFQRIELIGGVVVLDLRAATSGNGARGVF